MEKSNFFPPPVHGIAASKHVIQVSSPQTVIHYLSEKFPAIPLASWQSRCQLGKIFDNRGSTLSGNEPCVAGTTIYYYREIPDEPVIPFQEKIIAETEHLLVVDKPHFLPTIPGGNYVQQTLLTRLRQSTGNYQLVPLHRLDKDTAGLVLLCKTPDKRESYSQLFRNRSIHKQYLAIAAKPPSHTEPFTYRSRLVKGEPFYRMQEISGPANAETRISPLRPVLSPFDVQLQWLYQLEPVTGQQHQLRVHMAALGIPILNDPLYPELKPYADATTAPLPDYSEPLQLLASTLKFIDPENGEHLFFKSSRQLDYLEFD